MRALAGAALLACFALGFAAGRGDGHAYAGVGAAALAGLLVGVMASIGGAVCIVTWIGREAQSSADAAAKAAHVEQEV